MSEASYPPITITNVLLIQTLGVTGLTITLFLEITATSLIDLLDLFILGLLDVAVKEYSTQQQSRLGDEALKVEVRKACDVALDDGLDLAQIDEDKNLDYFTKRGVKWGIARRFVKDIRFQAENVMVA